MFDIVNTCEREDIVSSPRHHIKREGFYNLSFLFCTTLHF